MRKIWSIILVAVLFLWGCGGQMPEDPAQVSKGASLWEETAQTATEQQIRLPESLAAMLEKSGLDAKRLTDLDCVQLVTVETEGVDAKIRLYILESCQWTLQEALTCTGFVGRSGATDKKTEGDKATPKGLFPVTQAFYIQDAPQTGLPLFEITQDTYWVDDPESAYYNKRIEGLENKDWVSAEHMFSYQTAYACGFVIGYNMDAVPYAGSAIFFHVGSAPTAGCVATEKDFVLQYLAALDSAKTPYILIG